MPFSWQEILFQLGMDRPFRVDSCPFSTHENSKKLYIPRGGFSCIRLGRVAI